MSSQRERQCGRKVIYVEEAEASRFAKAMHKRYKAHFDAYACPFCAGWHVGQRRSPQAAARRAERRSLYAN